MDAMVPSYKSLEPHFRYQSSIHFISSYEYPGCTTIGFPARKDGQNHFATFGHDHRGSRGLLRPRSLDVNHDVGTSLYPRRRALRLARSSFMVRSAQLFKVVLNLAPAPNLCHDHGEHLKALRLAAARTAAEARKFAHGRARTSVAWTSAI